MKLGNLFMLAGAALGYGALMWTKELSDRRTLYNQAESFARDVGKPMLVVGTPRGRHGCGDLNIDISDVTTAECPNFIQANIEDLSMFENREFGSVFVGHVLEHVDDIEKAFFELCRIADRVFVAYPAWYSVFAYISPGHKWLILSAPPETDYLWYVKLK